MNISCALVTSRTYPSAAAAASEVGVSRKEAGEDETCVSELGI